MQDKKIRKMQKEKAEKRGKCRTKNQKKYKKGKEVKRGKCRTRKRDENT